MSHSQGIGDTVSECRHGVHFLVQPCRFVTVLVGCESIIVPARCGKCQIGKLHHCLKVFWRAVAVDLLCLVADTVTHRSSFACQYLFKVYGAEVAQTTYGDGIQAIDVDDFRVRK